MSPRRYLIDERPTDGLGRYLKYISAFREVDVTGLEELARGQVREGRPNPLEAIWYRALSAGRHDYSVYGADEYIADAWHCWVGYSRGYLRFMRANLGKYFGGVRRVVDLGCGFGYTTRALRELFPDAEVVGTQIEGTLQYEVATRLGAEYGFSVVGDIASVGQVDLVFASEYFEHIYRPIEHIAEIVDEIEPGRLVVANAFGTRSAGHFESYRLDCELISPVKASRMFNDYLRARGYSSVVTGAWNNRPRLWAKEGGE